MKRSWTALFAAGALAAGCAKIEPPSGGPEDKAAPIVVYSVPADGAGGVPRDLRLVLGFSERMDEQSVEDWIVITPALPVRSREWSGGELSLTFRAPLDSTVTYALLLGAGAKDRRGNAVAESRQIVFSAGLEPAKGAVAGTLEAVKQKAEGVLVWAYEGRSFTAAESSAGVPDFEHHDPDRIAQTDAKGVFVLRGLVPGARYLLYGLLDLDGNRRYSPGSDFMDAADDTAVAAEEPVMPAVKILLVHPLEPGAIAGVIAEERCAAWLAADTLATALRAERALAAADSLSAARAESLAAADTSGAASSIGDTLGLAARRAEHGARIDDLARAMSALPAATREDSAYCAAVVRIEVKADADTGRAIFGEADRRGAFTVSGLTPGSYRLGAFRDLDGDGGRGSGEPATADTVAAVRPGRTTTLPPVRLP